LISIPQNVDVAVAPMRRGELWTADLGGQVGLRPVLLLSRDGTYQFRNQATVALVTRTIREIRTQVRVGPDDGLDYNGVINCDDIHTIYLDQLRQVIRPLAGAKLRQVEEAVLVALGIDCSDHL
jgi:mRNA interferase MazF